MVVEVVWEALVKLRRDRESVTRDSPFSDSRCRRLFHLVPEKLVSVQFRLLCILSIHACRHSIFFVTLRKC